MTSHNPNALAVAQSASEIFDVMHPPTVGFDMYTDRPVPTGESKPRGLVHKLKMWHWSVRVCLVDPDRGMVALQKRSPNKDTFPEMWEIGVAGHIESGDESRPTAVREVAEELGVICVEKDLRFLGCVPMEQACMGGCNCFEDVYFLRCDSEATTFALGKAEVTAAGWFCMKELEGRMKKGDAALVPMTATFQHAFFRELRDEYRCGG